MGDDKLHFVLLPFMAQGHAIPMIDIAKLLASRSGTTVTLLLTPLNHIQVKPILSRSSQLGAHIHVEELHFPAEEAGLPAGCENVDALPSPSLISKFCFAANMLQSQVETLLKKMMFPKQSCCLVADMSFIFAAEVSQKLGIPRIFFNGMNCFASLCIHHILTCSNILDTVSDEFEYFDVPGMPHKISFTKSQVKGMATPGNKERREAMEKLMRNESTAYGVIFNTFEDLEHVYIRHYENVRHRKIWSIGPLSMFDKELAHNNAIIRGQTSSVDVTQCLKWLDSWELGTVIYACLGSFCNLTAAQMLELGLGLEASGRPFIWVVGLRNIEWKKSLQQLMVRNGYEERVSSARRGLLIWGWAPQVQILSHQAVGGFLTHCGWNSSLEGVSAGIPMVTWPLFADQFYNEKFLVDILKIGVRVGVKRVMEFGKEEEIGVQVHGDEVRKAVEELMDGGGEEGEARRRRVRELAEKAKKAVGEGGSSQINVENFIKDARKFTAKKTYA
uniref:Glycosyltransferase n=1 Tax=Kalanchoe fedtschenkoi TaxID=63787 RepID=A0A7N0V1B7_KALFE